VPFGDQFFNVNEPLRAQGPPIGVKRWSLVLLYKERLLRKGLFEEVRTSKFSKF
jgi:hypothetical protein